MSNPTTATTPLPSPPFLTIPGLPNFRDAGGYALANDSTRMVRRNFLFRASEPSQLTDDGVRTLTEKLGITHVYDLRSQTEIDNDTAAGKRQVREWQGSQRVFAPVFAVEDYSPEAIALRFTSFAQESSEVRFFGLISWRQNALVLSCGEKWGSKCCSIRNGVGRLDLGFEAQQLRGEGGQEVVGCTKKGCGIASTSWVVFCEQSVLNRFISHTSVSPSLSRSECLDVKCTFWRMPRRQHTIASPCPPFPAL